MSSLALGALLLAGPSLAGPSLAAPSLAAPTTTSSSDAMAAGQALALGQAEQPASANNRHPDARWFPAAGLGLFIHWGISAVQAKGDLSWCMLANKSWYDATIPPAADCWRDMAAWMRHSREAVEGTAPGPWPEAVNVPSPSASPSRLTIPPHHPASPSRLICAARWSTSSNSNGRCPERINLTPALPRSPPVTKARGASSSLAARPVPWSIE